MLRTLISSSFSVFVASIAVVGQAPILEAHFDAGPEGFTYRDDAFRGTAQPAYADGAWQASGGYQGGALRVALGGIDNDPVLGMSGGFDASFVVNQPLEAALTLRCLMTQTSEYDFDELSQVLVAVDGTLLGQRPFDYAVQTVGNGNGGGALTMTWKVFRVHLGLLAAGTHALTVGGYNNKKTDATESTEVWIDDVAIAQATPRNPAAAAQWLVSGLDYVRFKADIETLSNFGDRTQGSASYAAAAQWVEQELTAVGYAVQRHAYVYQTQPRDSIYVTKVGLTFPDRMFLVSAHLDGRGGGGAADDDGSGCALLLACARALAQPGVETEFSVRFAFWNNEETGLQGSTAYANGQHPLQGIENPAGSGLYPEPTWLGMIQHDMILFDHGLPPQPLQIPAADMDIEYQAVSTAVTASLALSGALHGGNQSWSAQYPSEIGDNMRFTDSWPFRHYTAAVSMRENQRVAEIGNGANPHWHQPTDLYATYDDLDFALGFDTVRTTLGTVAELAEASIASRFTTFGSGCAGSAGTPALAAAGGQGPWIGETFAVALSSLPPSPANVPFGVIGTSNTTWGPLPLPVSLAVLGMPTCDLLVTPDLIVPLVNAGGTATWAIAIPADPALVGGIIYLQAYVVDPPANRFGLTVSNGGEAQLGAR